MDVGFLFARFGIALGLGLLVGLQRQRTHSRIAGFRTFTLSTLLGSLCAVLAQELGLGIVGWGLAGLAGLLVAANLSAHHAADFDPGMTTEVAMLVMFGVGALAVIGPVELAIALGGGTAVLLSFKAELHGLARRISDQDLRAIMQFVLLSLVVLPVLPDRTMGPYSVLNPRQVWWMVVLIVGLSLGGYLAFRLLGPSRGAVLGGLLGGLVSSTATTVTYARRSLRVRDSSELAALVIVLASAVVFLRVLVEIAVVSPATFVRAVAPLGIVMGVLAGAAVVLGRLHRQSTRQRAADRAETPDVDNPSELGTALAFGALYAAVLLAVAFMKDRFGDVGLYGVAALSGLTDMDAITLSVAHLVEEQQVARDLAWRVILLAAMSNLVFKGAMVAVLGDRRLMTRIVIVFGLVLTIGASLIVIWPGA